jgi:hypothetical protein
MAQEFTINSQAIESKINSLLPSQGNAGAGIDFSASTMVIPIIDLTETAEGSQVRADLQTALSFNSVSEFSVSGTTSTLINTTGYYRVFGAIATQTSTTVSISNSFLLNDAVSTKTIWGLVTKITDNRTMLDDTFDFVVFLRAGDTLSAQAGNNSTIKGSTRQIATLTGDLVDP